MSSVERPRILVAEDETVSRMNLSRFLERELNAEVLTASNGLEAWEIFTRNGDIQFVISDWVMPGLTGVELCQRIRRHSDEHYTYVILLTGRELREDLLMGIASGADEYLVKPFDPVELKLRVRAGMRIVKLEQVLAAQKAQLEQAFNTLEQGVHAAAKVQRHLLPDPSSLSDIETRLGLRIVYESISCESLGGDIVGLSEPAPGMLALFLADVSGHGIAASMAAVSLNSFIRTFLRSSHDPLEVISQANRFCADEFPPEVYATLVFLLAEPGKQRAKVIVAGHPPLIRLTAAGELFEYTAGMPPLGLFPEPPGPEALVEIPLKPGDRLVAYTDGVVETRNFQRDFYSKELLVDSIRRAPPEAQMKLPEHIINDLEEWRGSPLPAEDDITILSLSVGVPARPG
jgi:sigma-B regulation protein RsbU (phosphoserine phosphatase)